MWFKYTINGWIKKILRSILTCSPTFFWASSTPPPNNSHHRIFDDILFLLWCYIIATLLWWYKITTLLWWYSCDVILILIFLQCYYSFFSEMLNFVMKSSIVMLVWLQSYHDLEQEWLLIFCSYYSLGKKWNGFFFNVIRLHYFKGLFLGAKLFAKQISGKFLMSKIYYAEFYAFWNFVTKNRYCTFQ